MTQETFLNRILDLKRANPEMEIHFCIDSEEINDAGWTDHKIVNVEIMPWYQEGEEILVYRDHIFDHFTNSLPLDIPADEAVKIVEERFRNEVKYAICVFTSAA